MQVFSIKKYLEYVIKNESNEDIIENLKNGWMLEYEGLNKEEMKEKNLLCMDEWTIEVERKIGYKKCNNIPCCKNCPLKKFDCGEETNDTLYERLEKLKLPKIVYEYYKQELDKEV